MEWATRRKIRISRAATAWLIRRFIDPQATFFFGSDEEVLAREAQGAIGFHVAGTRYGKRKNGSSPIEALVQERCPDNAVLPRFAEIVRDADGPAGREQHPEAVGVRLMTVAFPDVLDDDDEIVRRSALLYDSLYAALSKVVVSG
jgi:hypothetical protein